MPDNFKDELKTAVNAALSAGVLLREEFRRPGGPRGTIGHAEADDAAERLIMDRLETSFPQDSLLGEETGGSHGMSGRLWLVDPNDGTSAYMEGFRGAAVSIALIERGEPVLGVVYAYNHPDDRGDLIAWAKDGPVLRNNMPVRRTWPEAPGPACTVLLSHHADKNPSANALCVAPMRYRAMPSIAYRLALVAAGEGDVAVSLNGPVAWDVAGGHAILLGASGDLYDKKGQPIRYTSDGHCSPSSWVFGGQQVLIDYLRKQNWSRVFKHPSKAGPYPLCGPKPGGGPLDPDTLSRAQGCLLGQLAGDSLGSLVEFKTPEYIKGLYPEGVRELADGGTFNTLAGQPTDDSEMALILARSIIERGGYDSKAARKAYTYWYESHPFDCGTTTSSGLTGHPNHSSQANGAMMRISPLGIFGTNRGLDEVARWAQDDAALTHPNPVCLQANALYAMAVAQAIRTGPKPKDLYNQVVSWARDMKVEPPLVEAINDAADSPPKDFTDHEGWVLIAFRNSVYQLLHAESLEKGVIQTVMQGGDTDTNAAVCGALLGAVYGRDAIPAQWTDRVLTCRPIAGLPGVHHPRPECFWPVDAMILAERLLRDS
jgi:ADP-ribosyl-[dinitrogen reductase] hydrolase